MLEEDKTLNSSESSTEQDANGADSSTAQDANAGDSSTSENVRFDQHPRFQELVSDNKTLKQQLDKALDVIRTVQQPQVQNQVQQVEQKNVTQKTQEDLFWEEVDRRAELKAEAKIQTKEKEFKTQINSLYSEYGKMAANEFLKSHPDVKKGSEELNQILQYAQTRNIDLEDAYWVVQGPKKVQEEAQKAASDAKKQTQIKTQQKIAANVEQKSIPQSSTIVAKTNSSKSIEMDEFAATAKELGIDF